MSQMLDITTPRKSNFSEGADLRTPKEGILLSTQQKVNSIQPPTQFSSLVSIVFSETTLKISGSWLLKKTVVDRRDI